MTSREKIAGIFVGNGGCSTGFWTGNPHVDTMAAYLSELGGSCPEDLYRYLNDDCRWIVAERVYRHPQGRPAFDLIDNPGVHPSRVGYFADCESLADIDSYPWPNAEWLDFDSVLCDVRAAKDKAVFTGSWASFFHIVADLFGMENYFIKMHTHPAIVEAVTERVLDYYLQANRRYFSLLGDNADYCFFGNDLGTQRSPLVSPECFRTFVLPGIRKIVAMAKGFGKKVLMHSCGAIAPLIPLLIDAGVDALHPLQAKAVGMDAETLSREFGRHLVFVGGVDTQELLVRGTPQQITAEVRRLKKILGPRYIVSPSHEAILPNVPLANIIAMSQAAHETE